MVLWSTKTHLFPVCHHSGFVAKEPAEESEDIKARANYGQQENHKRRPHHSRAAFYHRVESAPAQGDAL